MNWDNMKVFLAIAGQGGLNKAATELGIHHTSCARRIKAFETEMGVKLFDRLPSGYALTQAGESLYQSGQIIRQEFNTIETDLAGKDLRLEGDICLTIPLGFALHLLMPHLRDFTAQYPDVNLEINMTYAMKDLANREADVAIRHVDNPPDSLAGKRVARVFKAAYASTEYLRTHDPQKDPQGCHWLGWGRAANHLQWAGKVKYPDIPVKADMYSDVLQLEAVKKNIGIASLPCFLGDLAAGVQRIDNSDPSQGDWVWVLAHKDMVRNAKVRILMEFLHASFQTHKNALEGLRDLS
jgi:DNA-binding transcriptional LysR family regulator